MISKNFHSWWEQYREAVKCSNLRQELWLLLYGEGNEGEKIERLINQGKYEHPGESESWYLEKAIDNFRRRFSQS